jgi:F-type H+-transporting ATPase subunit b
MPQLNVATFTPQVFWLFVTFFVLFVLMQWVAAPRVGAILARRRRTLEDDLSRASELKAQAEAVLAAYEKTLASARGEAQATMRETTERLAAEAAQRQRELAQTLTAKIEEAERRIAAAKDAALGDVRGIAVDVARALGEKLTGAAAPPDRLAAAVDEAMRGRAMRGRAA